MASGRADAPVATDAQPKRRRLPGVNLRPGSVKQARVEASLSLAQLGKGRVTAPAIYLIETGRTRPSLPTLEHIARRTGKPVEYFLAAPAGAADEGQASLIAYSSCGGIIPAGGPGVKPRFAHGCAQKCCGLAARPPVSPPRKKKIK